MPLRPTVLKVAAVTILLGAASAQAADDYAHTTRIEPSNAYGATVTIEEGVRVFRPLPSERHVIINPEGRTPLGLNYYDLAPGVPLRGAAVGAAVGTEARGEGRR